MASNPQPGASSEASGSSQEYKVRVPRDRKKKYKMMKFSSGTEVDFVKLSQTQVRMERENNLKEYKTAHDIDTMPKFGAGSEFGREQKEIARRKKYGIMMKKYDPNNQPWHLKIGKSKDAKKFKGVREGTISDNTSYYIFTQCADGAFDAFPIEEWYNFTPMVKYKYLNAEEAEEEFNKRDKRMNLFSIMVRKRVKNEDADENLEEEEKPKKSNKGKKSSKDFLLTDQDDWANLSDDDDDDYDDDDDDDGGKKKKKDDSDDDSGKKKSKKKKPRRNAKTNSDDEAVEESDEGDFDDREVDYITDSDSSMSETGDREKTKAYEETGVAEEKGLRKLIDSDESSEEEEEKTEQQVEEEKKKEEKEKKTGSDSDSSSSSSGSDSDIEKEGKFNSAIFMQRSKSTEGGSEASVDDEKKAAKRKLESDASSSKKMRTDSPSFAQLSSSGGITEDAIRRYLMWKPMTAKELLQKFKSKRLNMTKDEMTSTIAKLLRKINPDKKTINSTMYLSLKPDT